MDQDLASLSEPERRRLLALLEERQALEAYDSLAAYCRYVMGLEPAEHHLLMIDALERLERDEYDILIIMMPPGSAKSMYASIGFPSWWMGRRPQSAMIAASNTGELAERFGRKVRNLISTERYQAVFPGVAIAGDSSAAGRWETSAGGEYFAAGVGGAIAGRRADLADVDDPIKSREEADSEVIREKQWSWWRDDLKTRLKPTGKVVLIMCMTGDTPVLLPSGSEKLLRDIRSGDRVASYKDGKLVTATVCNWINNGPDLVYVIRTTSGTLVKANARHPFLVCDDGEPKWVRVKDLVPGQEIFRVSGGSGREKSASTKAVTNQPNAEGIVRRTTTRFAGLKVLGRLHATANRVVVCASSIAMALLAKITTACMPNRMVNVPFVASLQEITSEHIGEGNCASITATKQVRSEGCCATNAIWSSDMQNLHESQTQRPSTSDFTLDRVVEIAEAGIEDVFDIQVEGTENFIAGGLVSHNTRWHEDDLCGRVLSSLDKELGRRVAILTLPMEAEEDDPLGRQPGERLWPEWFTPVMVEEAKQDPRTWTSLYQQRPRPIGGGELKREWLLYWKNQPAVGQTVILVDPASGRERQRKSTRGNDFTSFWVLGVGVDGNRYVVDGNRDRLNLTGRTRVLFELVRKWKPAAVFYEEYGLQADIEHILTVQEAEQYRFRIIPLGGSVPKNNRIRRLIPRFQRGEIWMPKTMPRLMESGIIKDIMEDFNVEYLGFPVAVFDDSLDNLARMEDPEVKAFLVPPQPKARLPDIPSVQPAVAGFGM